MYKKIMSYNNEFICLVELAIQHKDSILLEEVVARLRPQAGCLDNAQKKTLLRSGIRRLQQLVYEFESGILSDDGSFMIGWD